VRRAGYLGGNYQFFVGEKITDKLLDQGFFHPHKKNPAILNIS
jgi:hypothetical protein